MARLGVLKPLRGTESSLANVVLDEGELAFSYPTSGPGTGLGGIKMGDGTSTFSSLPWYITGEGSGPTPDPWQYDEGTDEAALLNNIKHPEYETIGKTYYIQAYLSNTITQNVPYKVIGINHDGTENTMDLMSMVGAKQQSWSTSAAYTNNNAWKYGKYTSSNFYSWISDTCPLGYSGTIKLKMCYMTERWREATGERTGILQTRQTKCKLLNPYEIAGEPCVNQYYPNGATDFNTNDFITYDYGEFYSGAFQNKITDDLSKIRYSNLNLTSANSYWLNSYFCEAFKNSTRTAIVLIVKNTGQFNYDYVWNNNYLDNYLIVPVIRLSNNP